MIFYLYDQSFKRIKTIDKFENAIWHTRHEEAGEFTIKIPLENFTNEFKINYFIKRNDRENIGIIEDIEREDNLESGVKYAKITGRFASVLWEWRVNNAYLTYSNLSIDAIVNNLYVNHFTTGNRILPQFHYIRTDLFSNKITSIEDAGTNCYEIIKKVFATLKMGFTERLQDVDGQKKIVFSIYEGVDRSKAQKENTHVVFSGEFDNLTNSKHVVSYRGFKNVAYVGIKEDGNQLKIKKLNEVGAGSGINRKETFVFGSDRTNEQTADEWENVLNELGKENLVDITEQFDGDIVPELKYKFSPENKPGCYWVGDIVTVENKKLNVSMNVKIYEAMESFEGKNRQLVLTFGLSGVNEND